MATDCLGDGKELARRQARLGFARTRRKPLLEGWGFRKPVAPQGWNASRKVIVLCRKHTRRDIFGGVGVRSGTDENMVLTSLRFSPFQ